jgi:hypothetical protein
MAHVAHSRCRSLPVLLSALAIGCSSEAAPEPAVDSQDATTGSEHGDASSAPAPSASSPLPATTKGYELYAWDESGALSFTLITGTNRLKTADEITTGADAENGEWVVLHGEGLDALERVLARVPAGTNVILTSLQGVPPLSAQGRSAVMRALADSGR